MFNDLLVTEIFFSLQGETSLSGVPFIFIRLTGCNLRCTYCDSAYAFKGGTQMSVTDILKNIEKFPTKNVLITGGEPLLQRQTPDLVDALIEKNYFVSIETHGEIPIESVSKKARIIMDIKTPGSQMNRGEYLKNFKDLKKSDEIKFVITSKEDYAWAKELVKTKMIPTQEILFSPAVVASDMPGKFEGVTHQWLAEKILEDGLAVRFQTQLHKLIWGANQKGV